MKALAVMYALGVFAWMGVLYGNAPHASRQQMVRAIGASLIWPVVLVFAAGQLLGKWARK